MDDLASFFVGPVIATPPARLLLPVLVRPKGTHRLLTMSVLLLMGLVG